MRKRININHKSITRKVLRGKSRHARGVGQDHARVRVHKHRANVVIWKERVQARERRTRAQHAKLRRIQTYGLARKQHGDNRFIFLRVLLRSGVVWLCVKLRSSAVLLHVKLVAAIYLVRVICMRIICTRMPRIFCNALTNRPRNVAGCAVQLRIRGELPVRALSARWNINRNHIWMKRNIVRKKISQQLHQMYLMNYYAK